MAFPDSLYAKGGARHELTEATTWQHGRYFGNTNVAVVDGLVDLVLLVVVVVAAGGGLLLIAGAGLALPQVGLQPGRPVPHDIRVVHLGNTEQLIYIRVVHLGITDQLINIRVVHLGNTEQLIDIRVVHLGNTEQLIYMY